MGNFSSTPQVKTNKLTSEQIQSNIKQLFTSNEKHDSFNETIGFFDSDIQRGGDKIVSPQKRYEQFNIDKITAQQTGGSGVFNTQKQVAPAPKANFNPINMTTDKYSELSSDMSEIKLLKSILQKQTGGCGSDNSLSATTQQPIRYSTMKGGEVKADVKDEKKNEKKDEKKDHKKKKEKSENDFDEEEEIDLDEDDLEDDEDLDDEDAGDNIERLMTQDGSSESSSSSSTSSGSSSSYSAQSKKKNTKRMESSSQSGGEINIAPFYSSESRSDNFKHMQKKNRFN